MGRFEPDFKEFGERLVFESALGLGFLGLLILALGLLQLFALPYFAGLLLLMAALSWKSLSGVISNAISCLRKLRQIRWQAETAAIGVLLLVIGFFTLIRALAPPIGDDWDSLAYHLAVPKLFLQHHGIYYVDFTSHSNFPFTWEMLYSLGLAFDSIALAKLFHFMAGVLLVGAVYSLGKRHLTVGSARLGALIVATMPLVVWEATTAYVDLATALYSLLVVYALMNYTAEGDRRWALLAGISAGMAAGTKMTALIMAAIAVVWILWPKGAPKQPRIKTAFIVALLSMVIAAPWYIKSWAYTGNPVYPFAYSVFGGRNWSETAAELYREDQLKFGLGRDAAAFLTLPWNLAFRFARFNDYGARWPRDFDELPQFSGDVQTHLSSVGPMFLVLLPVIVLSALRQGRHRPLLAASLAMTVAWFFMMQNTRYLIPILAILAPAAAYSTEVLKARKAILWAALAVGLFTTYLAVQFALPTLPVVFRSEREKDYLTRNLAVYRASNFINVSLPDDAKIAMFGETRGFYLDRDYFWADPGHNALVPYDRIGTDPNRLFDWLEEQGFQYLMVNHANYPIEGSLIGEAVGNELEMLYVSGADPSRSVVIYKIVR
ncbi:MAG TPA: glycosyltransferase family 39 protein [Armatimonadota bacterium]|nr:glycosyltransferase family 39 protein [Armatimonadota bacterium]